MEKTRLARRVWQLVLPVDCLNCGQEVDWLCGECLAGLVSSRSDRCRICGKAGDNGLCEVCRKETGLSGLVSLFNYHEKPIQGLIKKTKYTSHPDALIFFTNHFRRRLVRQLDAEDWVFSFVPITKARKIERGFNQAELLCRRLAGSEYAVQNLFTKNGETVPQAGLDKTDRRKNVKGSFDIVGKAPTHLVICDDVVTTGSTLKELAKLAKKAGTKEVWAVTIAHG